MVNQWLIVFCCSVIVFICLFQDAQGATQCENTCTNRCRWMSTRNRFRAFRRTPLSCAQRCAKLAQTCTSCFGPNRCLKCAAGYTKNSAARCVAVERHCWINNGGCSAYATCTEVSGTISCTCNRGFAGDGRTCTDIDECSMSMNYGNCSSNAICTNTPGSFSCTCNTGFATVGSACLGWMLQSNSSKRVYLGNNDYYVYANDDSYFSTNADGTQVSFLMKPCLASEALPAGVPAARCVSFQPEYKFRTGYYLRQDTDLNMAYEPLPPDSSTDPSFNADASFIMHPNLFIPGYVAFESVSNPGSYIRIPNNAAKVKVKIKENDGFGNFQEGASFTLVARPDPWPPIDSQVPPP